MEQNKLLWIVFSVSLFLLVVIGIGLIWLYPGAEQPVTAEEESFSLEAGAEFDPIEWVRSEQEAPGLDELEAEEEGGNFVVVYGESDEPGPEEVQLVEEQDEAVENLEYSARNTGAEKAAAAPENREPSPSKAVEAAPVTRTVNVKEYWIQTGSYTSRSRADSIKQQLDELGLSGRILSKDVEGTQYYRVRIGPYSQKAEADKFLTWVKQQEDFQSSYISEVYRKKTVVQ